MTTTQQVLMVLVAVAGGLGGLGGLAAMITAITGRKTTERSLFAQETHELLDAYRQRVDDLVEEREQDRAEFERRLTEAKAESNERFQAVEERLDRCEEEKATMREERLELLRELGKDDAR